eukprot:1190965-Prorocentrum_minimum.AAC.6
MRQVMRLCAVRAVSTDFYSYSSVHDTNVLRRIPRARGGLEGLPVPGYPGREEREEGGTQDVVGGIRLGLAFQLKAAVGAQVHYCSRLLTRDVGLRGMHESE